MKVKTTAIILSAGMGKRMQADRPKQYLLLKDKPIIYYTLKTFAKSKVDEIILVVGKDDVDYCKREIIDKYNIKRVSKIVVGGKERYNSVMNGLDECSLQTDYVLIHDGARPFVTTQIIDNIIKNVVKEKACIAAMPVKDTIKVVDSERNIVSTPKRSSLWLVQTPQAFDYAMIKKAYECVIQREDEIELTDDAMVWENFYTQKVKVVESSYTNIKITTKDDLLIGDRYLDI